MSLARRKTFIRLGAAASVCLVVAGCSSSDASSDEGGGETDRILNIGMSGDTLSLDPLTCAPPVYCFAAYDGLVYQNSDGEFEPDLASSWEFTDASNTTLRVQLREDVVFTDGSPLNADAVVASLNRFLNSVGPNRSNAEPVTTVTAVDGSTVDISYRTAVTYDYASYQLTKQNGFGMITSQAAAENPQSLASESAGVGPYKLDPEATEAGTVYTFVPNEDYFNQDAITYDQVVFTPIPNASSRVSALQTGQIDFAQTVPPSLVDSAADSDDNIRVSEGSLAAGASGTAVLVMANRETGPLADERVREAIALAIPRDDIIDAIYSGYGTGTSSLVPDGAAGYNEDAVNAYDYNVDRAKQLLEEAGYGDGLTISVLDPTFFDPGNALGQALGDALQEVGVTFDLTTNDSQPGEIIPLMQSGDYDAIVYVQRAAGTYATTRIDLSPGGYLNPLGTPLDAELDQLVTTAATAPVDEQEGLLQEATVRLDELLWAIPVASIPSLQLTDSGIDNVAENFTTTEMDPFSPVTEQAWRPSGE